ncbi:type IV secretion system protein [Pelagibius sp. Alg239-R121]|uniref:type IV secretion system protein n=1 Tax=Pelagibius sp. Alg239-R121 TaxID=2993448 RepID=UPI0024A75631|nr:type IV secretion system protein [Pelagibius sp. Alg239-R121]
MRLLTAFLFVICASTVISTPEASAAAEGAQIGSTDYFTQQMDAFETRLNDAIKAVLDGESVFAKHVHIVFLVFLILSLLIMISKWVFARGGFDDIVGWFISTLLIIFVYESYTTLSSLIWGWFNELGRALQLAMVGDNSIYGPSNFISKIQSLITLDEEVDIWDEMGLILSVIVLWIVSVIVQAVSFLAAMLPVFGYAFAKSVGLFFVPFLFFQRTADWFDSWLSFFLGFCLFTFFSKAVLAVIALLYSAYFDIPYAASIEVDQIVIESGGVEALLGVIVLAFGSLLLFVMAIGASFSIMGGSIGSAISAQKFISKGASLGVKFTSGAVRMGGKGVIKGISAGASALTKFFRR